MSDPQQGLLYKLEDVFISGWLRHTPDLSRPKLQAYADIVCRRYRVPPVRVVLPRKKHWFMAEYIGDEDNPTIRLYVKKNSKASSRNVPVLLHELAHHVDDFKFDDSAESHGPRFVAILADMFDRYGVVPRKLFVAMAKKNGIRVARTRKKRR